MVSSLETAASDLFSIVLCTFAFCYQNFKTCINKNSIYSSLLPKHLPDLPFWLEDTLPHHHFSQPSIHIHPTHNYVQMLGKLQGNRNKKSLEPAFKGITNQQIKDTDRDKLQYAWQGPSQGYGQQCLDKRNQKTAVLNRAHERMHRRSGMQADLYKDSLCQIKQKQGRKSQGREGNNKQKQEAPTHLGRRRKEAGGTIKSSIRKGYGFGPSLLSLASISRGGSCRLTNTLLVEAKPNDHKQNHWNTACMLTLCI